MFHTLQKYLKEARLGIFPFLFLIITSSSLSNAAYAQGDAPDVKAIIDIICSAIEIISTEYIVGITSIMLAFALLVGLFQQFNSSMFVKILVISAALMAAGPLTLYIYGGSCPIES